MGPDQVFLSSLESRRFEGVFGASLIDVAVFGKGKPAILVSLDPEASPECLDGIEAVSRVLLTTRFEGDDILRSPLPLFVHIAVVDDSGMLAIANGEPVLAQNATSIAWGEIYATREKAQRHELR